MLTQEQAKQFIIHEWKKRPEAERQTVNQAALFAMQTERKYQFRSKARKDRVIRGWIIEYHISSGQMLRDR